MRYAALLVLLASCVRPPSAEEQLAADYGPYPVEYEAMVRQYIDNAFYDPKSVQDLEVETPKKYWISLWSGKYYGYLVAFRCNAKNAYGGYTGKKTHYLLVNNGQIRDLTGYVK